MSSEKLKSSNRTSAFLSATLRTSSNCFTTKSRVWMASVNLLFDQPNIALKRAKREHMPVADRAEIGSRNRVPNLIGFKTIHLSKIV